MFRGSLARKPACRAHTACPVAFAAGMLAPVLPQFMARYPQVRVELDISNRRVDLLAEGFDAALRVRTQPTGEDGVVMRQFAELCELLVASPTYLALHGSPQDPRDLADHDTLGFDSQHERQTWLLTGRDGASARVELRPRLTCHSFDVLLQSALAGCGIALLPESVVRTALARGELAGVLTDWTLPQGIFHVVFPHRRGLLPAVRAFIDFLVETNARGVQVKMLQNVRAGLRQQEGTTVLMRRVAHQTVGHLASCFLVRKGRKKTQREPSRRCRRNDLARHVEQVADFASFAFLASFADKCCFNVRDAG